MRAGYKPDGTIRRTLIDLVRKSIGPIVVFSNIFFVGKLPKTRSGKIMRRLIKAVITGKPLGDYSTIEDETSIEEIKRVVEEL